MIIVLRKYFPDVLFNASLGELQDSSEKRIESYQKDTNQDFKIL